MFHFYNPWKRKKNKDFLVFLGECINGILSYKRLNKLINNFCEFPKSLYLFIVLALKKK